MRAVIGWERVLHHSIGYKAELKFSRHLPNCTLSGHFPDFSPPFFAPIESEILEQANRKIATEEPNKVFYKCRAP